MSSVFRETYDKEIMIFNRILKNYHPIISEVCKDPSMSALMDFLCSNNTFNVEVMCEQAVAHVGGFSPSNEFGQDFCDESDLKVLSVSTGKNNRLYIRHLYRKKDKIRLIAFNPVIEDIDFFVFNISDLEYDKENQKPFQSNYSKTKNTYSKIQQFKVKDFEELCLKK